MDGMFYRRESDGQFDEIDPPPSVAKLLLLTVVVAAAVVGVLLLLSLAGVNVAAPSEFPSIAIDAG